MLNPKILLVILALGATALIDRLLVLYHWHVNRQVLVDTQTNGGVKVPVG